MRYLPETPEHIPVKIDAYQEPKRLKAKLQGFEKEIFYNLFLILEERRISKVKYKKSSKYNEKW